MTGMANQIDSMKVWAPCWQATCFFLLAALVMITDPMMGAEQGAEPISLNQIPSDYKPYAVAVGQRLQKPGKERITATGLLSFETEHSERTVPVGIVWQVPLRVRLNQPGSTLVFDRSDPAPVIPADQQMARILQTLVEDSVEGFLAIQKDVASTRHFGSDFRFEGADGTYSSVDIVQAIYPDVFRDGQTTSKAYYFSSRTKLLGLVAYSFFPGTSAYVVVDDWRDIQGEKIPFLIERWENHKKTMSLILSSASITAGVDDGTFGR